MPRWLRFSAADVARVRVQPFGPVAETMLAFGSVANRAPSFSFNQEMRIVRQRASLNDESLASYLWMTSTMAFDLFTLVGPTRDLSEGRTVLLEGPAESVAFEAESWASLRLWSAKTQFTGRPLRPEPPELAGLKIGAFDSRKLLVDSMDDFFSRVLKDRWSLIEYRLRLEQHRLEQALLAQGVDGLMSALGQHVAWQESALALVKATGLPPTTAIADLGDRGLVVTPSVFALRAQLYTPLDTSQPVLLIVPALTGADRRDRAGLTQRAATEKLLGRTRAAALAAIAVRPITTSELGDRVGIAISGASEHATVLRATGLITTSRDGGHVTHRITELGEALLEGRLGPPTV